jgi:primary-amine oxidase
MALDRLKQAASHVTGIGRAPHPLDPLVETEIEHAVAVIRKEYSHVAFNAITLWEPPKAVMLKWVKDPEHTPRPNRVADVVCIGKGSKVFDGLVDVTEGKILKWEETPDVQPLVRTTERTGILGRN